MLYSSTAYLWQQTPFVALSIILLLWALPFASTCLHSSTGNPCDSHLKAVLAAAKAEEKVKRQLEGMELVKTIVVKNKLVNLILRPKKLDNGD